MTIMLRLGKYMRIQLFMHELNPFDESTHICIYSIQVEGSENAMYSGTASIDTQVTITMTLMVVMMMIILTIILMMTVTMTKMIIMLMMTRRRRPVDTKL